MTSVDQQNTILPSSTHVRAKVLVIDDEAPIREVLGESLRDDGHEVAVAHDGETGLKQIEAFRPDVVFLDIWMPGKLDGIGVLNAAREKRVGCEFVVMSGHGTIETAVKSTKLGAWDFVEKPLSMEKISILLSNILAFRQEREDKNVLLTQFRQNIAIVGESEAMVQLKQMVARVAPSASWVLITGENGTGKELVAQNIHYLSPRASRPFVEVNCAAIPEDLIESELFGYEKGAFTGALSSKRGKFDLAHKGTLFLDEIGDMSLKTQAKILRVLQERHFERVGGTETIGVDVRVIAATTKNLETEMKAGRFREDLYYRLNVIPFHVSPLRERPQDLSSLVTHFSEHFAKAGGHRPRYFSREAIEKLQKYPWPGNVRELRNFVERVFILLPGERVDASDLQLAGLRLSSDSMDHDSPFSAPTFKLARAQFEKGFLLKKIEENKGNISKTAESIGLERSHLHRKIKAYGIEVN
jgi:two-component system nitrogen regulation response regulator NtrX